MYELVDQKNYLTRKYRKNDCRNVVMKSSAYSYLKNFTLILFILILNHEQESPQKLKQMC